MIAGGGVGPRHIWSVRGTGNERKVFREGRGGSRQTPLSYVVYQGLRRPERWSEGV